MANITDTRIINPTDSFREFFRERFSDYLIQDWAGEIEEVIWIECKSWFFDSVDKKLSEYLLFNPEELTMLKHTDNGDTYHFRIENGQAGDVIEGPAQNPDISMDAPMKKIMGILVGQIPPTRIIMEPSVKIRGSPHDLMFINKFLLKETPKIREILKTMNI